ncbi:retrovirus-related Pol polyprotein from transposon RE1 [Andrographis paniculata]|uniref:retrovirus-related Pol polyprotein from transposon RE1 n=1 Tax=Andrographis paniculata TaxID=175694 RepID=UPI0021E952F7|nr:retrovirus-related Pol polyprotein from transposon RE1 [Andrographis paniculata]
MATSFNVVWIGPKLDGNLDYNYWQIMMSTHLKAQSLWVFVEPGLADGADANTQRQDQLALGQIHQGVDYSVFGQIASAKTAKEAWDILRMSYKGVDRAQKSKLQSLRRLYDQYEMTSTETVEQYFFRLTNLVNKMRLYRDKIEDGPVVEKVLRTMPMKYDHVVASITESHDTELLSVEELKGMIESHIDRIAAKTEVPIEEALKSQITLNSNAFPNEEEPSRGRGRGRGRGNFRGRGRGNHISQSRDRCNNQDKFPFHCYNCGKYGHRIADCWQKNSNNQAHLAENSDECGNEAETLLLTSDMVSVP